MFSEKMIIEEMIKVTDGQSFETFIGLENVLFEENYFGMNKEEYEKEIIKHDVFKVIDEIVSFEFEQYGVTITDLADPIKVYETYWQICVINFIQEYLEEFWLSMLFTPTQWDNFLGHLEFTQGIINEK